VGVVLFVVLLLAVVEGVATWRWAYLPVLNDPQIAASTGLSSEERWTALCRVLDYARGHAGSLQFVMPAGGPRAGEPAFTEREVLHMQDVRVLFMAGTIVRAVGLTVLAVAAALTMILGLRQVPEARGDGAEQGGRGEAAERDQAAGPCNLGPAAAWVMRLWGDVCLWAAGWGAAGLALVGAAALIDFEAVFEGLHLMVFSNDLWQLPADALLIQLLPLAQFERLAGLIGLWVAAGLAPLGLTGWLMRSGPELRGRGRKRLAGAGGAG
jgi:hypothetical protein